MVQKLGDFDNLEKVKIKNKLLSSMFFHTEFYDSERINPLNCQGHYSGIARPYVSYLVQRLFNINRFPCCIEAIGMQDERTIKNFFESITDAEISAHLFELEKIYAHTQRQLSTISSTVRVRRGLRHDMTDIVACAVHYAQSENLTHIEVPCNTFDFFAFEPAGGFSDGVSFYRDIPITDILLCHHTVEGFHSTDSDVLVVNRNPRGIIPINLNDVKVSPDLQLSQEKIDFYTSCIERNSFNYTRAFKDFYSAMKYDFDADIATMKQDKNLLGQVLQFFINKYGLKQSPRIKYESLNRY